MFVMLPPMYIDWSIKAPHISIVGRNRDETRGYHTCCYGGKVAIEQDHIEHLYFTHLYLHIEVDELHERE
jgi:hypothetical protein